MGTEIANTSVLTGFGAHPNVVPGMCDAVLLENRRSARARPRAALSGELRKVFATYQTASEAIDENRQDDMVDRMVEGLSNRSGRLG